MASVLDAATDARTLEALGISSPKDPEPLARSVHLGSVGWDVIAVQRALTKTTPPIRKGHATGNFGRYTAIQVKTFQRRHGIAQTGVWGPLTHRAGTGRHLFDAYGKSLLVKEWNKLHPKPTPGEVMWQAALLGVEHRSAIHYTQGPERMSGVRDHDLPPHFGEWEDCSSFYTWCAWVAHTTVGGILDVNGNGWDPWGNTVTLANHGVRAVASDGVKGNAVFYGDLEHVTVRGPNILCVSHGQEAGPLLLSYNYRSIWGARDYIGA